MQIVEKKNVFLSKKICCPLWWDELKKWHVNFASAKYSIFTRNICIIGICVWQKEKMHNMAIGWHLNLHSAGWLFWYVFQNPLPA